MEVDVVCEGGGVKIGGLVGAIRELEDQNFKIRRIAGASAGAIIGALKASHFTGQELEDLAMNLDFRHFLDGNRFMTLYNWFVNQGIYKGDKFYEFMKETLASKGVYTFGDLIRYDYNDSAFIGYKDRWKLKVIVTDVTRNSNIVLPEDAALYGQDPDRLEVALAIRMSMSLPYFFRPVRVWDSWFIDGGTTSNFPIWLFDAERAKDLDCPTFGMLLDGGEYCAKNEITGWWTYMIAMINTMIQAHDRKFIHPGDFEHRIVKINTNNIRTADFRIGPEQKKLLISNGRIATRQFLETWSWDSYQTWARKRIRKRARKEL